MGGRLLITEQRRTQIGEGTRYKYVRALRGRIYHLTSNLTSAALCKFEGRDGWQEFTDTPTPRRKVCNTCRQVASAYGEY